MSSTDIRTYTVAKSKAFTDRCIATAREEILADIVHHLNWCEYQQKGSSEGSIKAIKAALEEAHVKSYEDGRS